MMHTIHSNPLNASANAAGNWWGASGGANTSGAQTTLGTVTTISPLSSAPSSCTINPNPTPTPTPSPTPTLPICTGFSLLEEEGCPSDCEILETTTLDDFGIDFEEPSDWSSGSGGEQEAILFAARETGRALCLAGAGDQTVVTAFRAVLQGEDREILFTRIDNDDNDEIDGDEVYCKTTNTPSNPTQSASIACDLDVVMTQYTAVHEFGHVLVGRTIPPDDEHSMYLDMVGSPGGAGTALETDSELFVFGPRSIDILDGSIDDWQRSDYVLDNGWGSAAQWVPTAYHEYPAPAVPPPTPTGYPIQIPNIGPCSPGAPTNLPPIIDEPFPMQQNPCSFSDEDALNGNSLIEEIDEAAAADMFLNWVYWKNYGPPPLIPTGTPTPSGFGDIRWRYASYLGGSCYPNGCDDPDDSGEARQVWMETVMPTLIAQFP